ncbi:MAG TPA: enoyl-CoA hydratase-related protein [Acidimicrobiales bacterium]|nr:enoyl-CoA hydratase-related protein [Acidimicrobiales bacterium]
MPVGERVADGVASVVIDRPPVNALSLKDLADLAGCFHSYTERPEVRVAVLSAAGRGFVGGGDIKEVAALPGHDGILGQAAGSLEASLAIHHCAVPVIAAVHGYCIGLGVILAASADLIVAATGTTFVFPEVDNGAAACGAAHASALLPDKRVRQAIFTGEPIDVAEIAAHGNIAAVVAGADLERAAGALAATIAAKPPAVVRQAKASLNATSRLDLADRYRTELGYLYELNLAGEAQAARADFLRRH